MPIYARFDIRVDLENIEGSAELVEVFNTEDPTIILDQLENVDLFNTNTPIGSTFSENFIKPKDVIVKKDIDGLCVRFCNDVDEVSYTVKLREVSREEARGILIANSPFITDEELDNELSSL